MAITTTRPQASQARPRDRAKIPRPAALILLAVVFAVAGVPKLAGATIAWRRQATSLTGPEATR